MLFLIGIFFGSDDLESLKLQFEAEKTKPLAQRTSTLDKIGALKTDEAAMFLDEILKTEKDEAIRGHTLRVLGICATPKAVLALIHIAQDEGQPNALRRVAIESVGKTQSKQGLQFLKEIIADAKHPHRSSAYDALKQYPLEESKLLWLEALNDSTPSVRADALRALAPLQDKVVMEKARSLLLNASESSEVRVAAVDVWKDMEISETVSLFLSAGVHADSSLRKTLVKTLGAFSDPKCQEALFNGLAHTEPGVRALVAQTLGILKASQALDLLERTLKDRDVKVRLAALESIAQRKEPRSEEILMHAAQQGDEETMVAAISNLVQFPSGQTVQLLIKLTSQKVPSIRLAALEALAEIRSVLAVPSFAKALESKAWQIRAVGIRGFGKLRAKESIDHLIDQLDREEGRLLWDAAEALTFLTGQMLGFKSRPWKDWWKVNRESFVFPEKTQAGAGGTGVSYHGIPIFSKRMIFCLDISGSMRAQMGNQTRIEMAKKELAKVLSSLEKTALVNLIFFDDQTEPWQKQIVPIRTHLDRALQRIAGLQARGGTNIYDTLVEAFKDPNFDTLYLLSDGAPSSGTVTDTEEILREIKRMNQTRQVVIHTISLGRSAFMRKLAEQNGGHYAEPKEV